jgi:hypothetical protein
MMNSLPIEVQQRVASLTATYSERIKRGEIKPEDMDFRTIAGEIYGEQAVQNMPSMPAGQFMKQANISTIPGQPGKPGQPGQPGKPGN